MGHVVATNPSRFAVWNSLETSADRWASYGALAVALGTSLVVFATALL